MADEDTKLVVYTIVVRQPKGTSNGWSVSGIDTRETYHDDIVDYSVIDPDDYLLGKV